MYTYVYDGHAARRDWNISLSTLFIHIILQTNIHIYIYIYIYMYICIHICHTYIYIYCMVYIYILHMYLYILYIHAYCIVPVVRDKDNMMDRIIWVFRSNTVNISIFYIYIYISIHVIKSVPNELFHVYVCVFVAAAGAFWLVHIAKNDDSSCVFLIAAAGACFRRISLSNIIFLKINVCIHRDRSIF